MKYLGFFICFMFLLLHDLKSQEFGANRFSTRWRQINNDTVRVIFPNRINATANEVANIVLNLAAQNKISLGNRLRKIDIVLQNAPVISNGYVSLGPFKSEFYLTPPSDNFDMGTLPWSTQLALHEYRHVQQYNNFYKGLSKAGYFLFGQEGYALAVNVAIPNWFYEGDAVFQETALSAQGRGRMPTFLKAYPTLWTAGKNYNWMKLRNGSLKNYVPNHYDLGYLLVNYGYEKYGPDFWKKITSDAAAFEGLFYPMQKAIKTYSGIRYKAFIKDAFDYYKGIYNIDSLKNINSESDNKRRPKSSSVENYFYPAFISSDSMLYLKNSNKATPAFYIKDSLGEHFLRKRDIGSEEQFSFRNGKIVYAATENHPRWHWEGYSVIKLLDIKTNNQKRLSKRSRYFSPDLSFDGKQIVANHSLINGGASLILLDAENGQVLKEIIDTGIHYYSTPKFVNDSIIISSIRFAMGKNALALINLNSEKIENITPPTFNTIGQINVRNDSAYFIASQGLKDEIFCINLKTRQLEKLITDNITNYFINANDNFLVWSNFTTDGYRLKQTEKGNAKWLKVSINQLAETKSGIVTKYFADTSLVNEISLEKSFTEGKYTKLHCPINIHSWRPFYEAPEYSLTIYGNNILNTTTTEISYLFNENDKTHAVGTELRYGGLFPQISFGSKFTFNRKDSVQKKLKEWNQLENHVGLSIPLQWTKGNTYRFFNVSSNYVYRNEYNIGILKDSFRTRNFGYLNHSISWAQQEPMARQHIFPRRGYSASVQYLHTTNLYKARLFFSKVNIFLPGLWPTHNLVVSAAMQEMGAKDRRFSNRMPYSRGFIAVDSARVLGVRTNYHFPLAYPDWGFANLLYLQRIRANIFYDFTKISGKKTSYKKDMQSIGTEIYFDTKWWNSYSLTFGMRGGYLLTKEPQIPNRKFFFELILPVSLLPN